MGQPLGIRYCVVVFGALALQAQNPQAASPDFFESKIRPILANSCYSCHTGSALGGLRVDSREAMLKGGIRGPALIPGDPQKSLLIQAVRQTDPKLKMPMGGKLPDSEIADLEAWVKAGASWPATAPIAKAEKSVVTPEARKFWSFQPLADPKPPDVKNTAWPKTGIDRFVLAKLEQQSLKPV